MFFKSKIYFYIFNFAEKISIIMMCFLPYELFTTYKIIETHFKINLDQSFDYNLNIDTK